MVIAFQGWNDAAEAASMAVDFLRRSLSATHVASIDPDEFFDFTAVRPQIKVDSVGVSKLTWPTTDIYLGKGEGRGRSVLVCNGIEPQLRWRRFSEILIQVADRYGVKEVVTLGALLSDVAHTKPVKLIGATSDPKIAEKLQLGPTNYEGPTGIIGVIQAIFRRHGQNVVSIWANVPHYVAQTPSPKAALAMVNQLAKLIDTDLDTTDLEDAASDYVTQIDEIIESDSEAQAYVAHLEIRTEEEEALDIISVDELAQEAERFLRGHGDISGGL